MFRVLGAQAREAVAEGVGAWGGWWGLRAAKAWGMPRGGLVTGKELGVWTLPRPCWRPAAWLIF